jgi:hypothetical protein
MYLSANVYQWRKAQLAYQRHHRRWLGGVRCGGGAGVRHHTHAAAAQCNVS